MLDKFTKSIKFILKESFIRKNHLTENDRGFFQFFNTEFSERFLSWTILDSIFEKKYFLKQPGTSEKSNEPDYFVRHGNHVFLFEVKDVLIRKDIKVSGDVDAIYAALKGKFLGSNKNTLGIGQLVKSIQQIVEQRFEFDEYISKKRNVAIYPILLVSDRIFEIHGINYKLNQWYLELVRAKLGDCYNPNFINHLTVIDFDTLIFWIPYLDSGGNKFRDVLRMHLKKMTSPIRKFTYQTEQEATDEFNKRVTDKLSPISLRLPEYQFPLKLITDRFQSVLSNE